MFAVITDMMKTLKNNLRTTEAQIVQKLKNNEARPKFTSSYKKKHVYNITVSTIILVAASLELGWLVYHGNVDVYMSVSVKCFIYIVYLLVNQKYFTILARSLCKNHKNHERKWLKLNKHLELCCLWLVWINRSHSYILLSQNGKTKTVAADINQWEETTQKLMDERDPWVSKTLKPK